MDVEVIRHYDLLVEEGNDPARDPSVLQAYMDQWDGAPFLENLALDPEKDLLEIGVGTGRLARRVCGRCRHFTGVDLSEKSVCRAAENLAAFQNVTLLQGDFLTLTLPGPFHCVYSSLTFLHIRDKGRAVCRAAGLLREGGRLVLSLDKSRGEVLDYGSRRLRVYPDCPAEIGYYMQLAGLEIIRQYQTARAWILVGRKDEKQEGDLCPGSFCPPSGKTR